MSGADYSRSRPWARTGLGSWPGSGEGPLECAFDQFKAFLTIEHIVTDKISWWVTDGSFDRFFRFVFM